MFHVGLDIHTKHIAISAPDEKGQVVHRSQVRSIQDKVRVLTGLPDRLRSATRRAAATATSTTCYGRWPRASSWRTRANCG
jgi:hypothetical protein